MTNLPPRRSRRLTIALVLPALVVVLVAAGAVIHLLILSAAAHAR